MKNVTFVVEFTTRINDDTDPEDVSFTLDPGCIRPYNVNTGDYVGDTTGYTTVNHYDDSDV